jgi:polysaccharide chain length determinant protein (PEP-CTERM system associated)
MAAQRELTLQDYISILQRRWVLITILAIVGAGAGYLASRVVPKRFTSKTLVLVQQPSVPSDLVKPVISDNSNQRLAAMQEQILSRSGLEPVIREFGLYNEDVNRVPMDLLVEQLRTAITITPIMPMAETRSQNLPGFTIAVVFRDPHLAQQICAKITSMFLAEHVQERQDQGDLTTQFLGGQLQDAKAKLDQQDAKLAAFKRRYLGSLPDEEQTNLNLLAGLTSQLEASTQALGRAQQDKSFSESVLSQQLAAWQATQAGQNPESLEQQLGALQAQLVTLQSKYTNDHPDVIKLQNDIATMKHQIEEADQQKKSGGAEKQAKTLTEPSQIQQLRAQIRQDDQVTKERTSQQEDIQKQIALYQARVQSSPAVEQEYKELTRDYQTALEFYNDLLKKRDQSAMANDLERSQQGEQFRVLDPANFPSEPSFPKMPYFVGGGFAGGLALGLVLSLLLEMQNTSLRSERDVELALRLPVLALVPVIEFNSKNAKTQNSILGSARSTASSGTRA